jgi:hypothetical protein
MIFKHPYPYLLHELEHGNSVLSAKISPLSLYGNAANSVISIKRIIL